MTELWSGNNNMNNMKVSKMLIFYLILVFPVFFTCLILIISGTVSMFYSGFAVDSSGVLYIGKETKIEKYYDGKMIGTISPQTSRGYAFTIQNDDTILLSTASTVYKMDLLGNVLDKQEDTGTKTFNKLQRSKNTFISQNNRKYIMKSRFGRTVIYSEKDIIYKMPMLDYVVKIAFLFVILSALIIVPIIIVKWKKCRN